MLTNFQKTVGLALDLSDQEAAKVQTNWPDTEDELQDILHLAKETFETDISGLQILTALPIVWRRRPADLEKAEGREILYHPVSGQPLAVNHPLGGLPWEMLAFLHWANDEGYLTWTDEIMIAREVSDGVIDNLPDDRFYAKNILPRSPDGEIDWSDLSLARAKVFVKQGVTLTQEPVYAGDDLITILASIPALQNEGARRMLLRGLPPGTQGSIRHSTATSTHLFNIIQTAEGAGMLTSGEYGINVVIKNAIRFVSGTQLEERLRQFMK